MDAPACECLGLLDACLIDGNCPYSVVSSSVESCEESGCTEAQV
jgi:hypothetical protein